MNKKIAVIDIGSNSVRLMIKEKVGVNQKLLNTTRLAENLSLTGFLSDSAISRTAKAVEEFFALAKQKGAAEIFVFATEAVRAAKNGNDFVETLKNRGIEVNVISGEREAEIGYLGAAGDKKSATVFDIGGASVEIVCGCGGKILKKKSLPLGLVRLRDLLGSAESDIEAYVQEKIPQFGAFEKQDVLIGIGGTATAIAAMLSGETVYTAEKIHGMKITASQVLNLKRKIFDEYKNENLEKVYPIISPLRAEIIAHGVIVTEYIMRHLGFEEFVVSETDNMEGYCAGK